MLRKDLLEGGREKGRERREKARNNTERMQQFRKRWMLEGGRSRAGFLSMRTHSSSEKQGDAWGEVMKEVASPHPLIS